MIPAFRVRHAHRGLAVIFGLQLLLWTVSGIYFAWNDIRGIRGEDLRREPAPVSLDQAWVSPTTILDQGAIRSLEVIQVLGRPHYLIRPLDGEPFLADAVTGKRRAELTREEAVQLARESFVPEAEVAQVLFLTGAEVGAHHEYRGRSLPAWRVDFDHGSGTRVYVAAREGTVQTHRNTSWRLFDALWMLHTMDYLGRDNINNPVLRIASVLGLSIIASGFYLWWVTRRRGRRKTQLEGDSHEL
jgi:uncharacterized iron-regulated membrane protein